MSGDLLALELTFVELLLLVFVVAMVVHRIRVPYTVALVLVGLALSFQQAIQVELTPEIILLLFLPPLVFEAALHIDYPTFRKVLTPVLLLAVFGVLITVGIVYGLLQSTGLLDWRAALIFASLIAATDPVAVVSLFKVLGAPRRLATLVESESLFNDATTIVTFHLVLAATLSHGGAETGRDFLQAVQQFLLVSLGGMGIGVVAGVLANHIFARVDDHLIEITLSTIIAYGSYLLAEQFHLSGVLAVVFAGMLIGNRSDRNMSPTTRMVLMNFWEYIAFLANSLVFILIGMEVVFPRLEGHLLALLAVALAAVLLSRAVAVYGLSLVSRVLRNRVPIPYQHVLFWGGLRGAVSLALALSIPRSFAGRETILTLTFAVVFFTLLVQATTISALLRRLGLAGPTEEQLAYERIHARLLAVRAAYNRLEKEYQQGMVDPAAWKAIEPELNARIQALKQELEAFAAAHPDLAVKITTSLRREALITQRAAILDLNREGVISDEVARELMAEIDAELDELRRRPASYPVTKHA
ncbi:MAG TPA: Na+/H+ antiporter [Anaerolineae bacterium]|nr:Na+/H+ antiporter [Anaerolineae bacterium]